MEPAAPLILTLQFDERSFTFFDAQRRRYFPPERNFIPAHLTLFHALPGEHLGIIEQDLQRRASGRPPFTLDVTGLRPLGRGVAYALQSTELAQLHRELALHWNDWLKPQDRQNHQPHVTLQNKVHPSAARALLDELRDGFRPFQAQAIGLELWWYRGGPWERARNFRFSRDITLTSSPASCR
ncbi:2'-5' RNA ligase family protein [Microvirga mediterraneensis]|uniref:2'-5' RNA ligase family protein n=1 Tax=Microvirga mediterraneensis TaxID=2754695 RepID=A0A838BIF9_9HYPH|nr:2'-5' RNA ligase family protein [Microvirga mediterraneensis]MBA1154975.1 2'-5' RNA ligase family protein [Microvirga mediterraneensis]